MAVAAASETPPLGRGGTGSIEAPERFSRFRAWRCGEAPRVSAPTPGMAEIYADIIFGYWETALAAGDLDPRKSMYVLELGAGAGRLTYLLIEALEAKRAQSASARFGFCYLASDPAAGNLERIASHPRLRPHAAAGRLQTLRWDAEHGGVTRLPATDNPLVVVADGVFARLTHDLFGFHYGRMYEGRVVPPAAAASGDHEVGGGEGGELEYRWEPISRADWLPAHWMPPLLDYAARLASAAVLWPSGALRCVDRLAELTDGRYLLLSADPGVHTEQQLRAGDGTDALAAAVAALPVNYHALARYQQRRGAWVWTGRPRADGAVLHLALHDRNRGAYEIGFASLARRLERAGPEDYRTAAEIASAAGGRLSPEQSLALVRLSRYDPAVLGAAIEPLLANLAMLTGECCRQWRHALERTWANYFALGDGDPFCFNFGLLALHLGYWGLAKEAFRLWLAIYGDDPAALYYLGYCEASSGQASQALAAIERALERDPENPHWREFRAALLERLGAWDRTPWYRRHDARDRELVLEPLGAEHAPSLYYQYRDPHIGVMTRLPALETLEAAVAWIAAQQREPGRALYAVMHDDYGFVGAVSIRYHGDAGYFYFWIGTDYQGAGFGRRAAALLFRQAANVGVRHVYTSAYADNRRSLEALQRLGFDRLDVTAREPDEDLWFFCKPLACSTRRADADRVRGLQRLGDAIASPIKLRLPAASSPRVNEN